MLQRLAFLNPVGDGTLNATPLVLAFLAALSWAKGMEWSFELSTRWGTFKSTLVVSQHGTRAISTTRGKTPEPPMRYGRLEDGLPGSSPPDN